MIDSIGKSLRNKLTRDKNAINSISKDDLRKLGIPLNSQEFADWLTKYGLRMLRPTRSRFIHILLAPEFPPDLKAAIQKRKRGNRMLKYELIEDLPACTEEEINHAFDHIDEWWEGIEDKLTIETFYQMFPQFSSGESMVIFESWKRGKDNHETQR